MASNLSENVHVGLTLLILRSFDKKELIIRQMNS